MTSGEKIARLRKSKGMTQEDLGKVLSVTYQAVSKWERGESLPDFETMSLIAKFFQVPLSYFEDGNDNPEPAPHATEPTPSAHPAEHAPIVGMCTECGRALKEDEVSTYSPKLICKPCAERRKQAAAEAQRREAEQRRQEIQRSVREELGSGFDGKLIISLVLAAICYILFMITAFTMPAEDRAYGSASVFLFPLIVFAITHSICGFINELRDKDEFEGYTRNLSLIVAAAFAAVNIVLFLILYLTANSSKDNLVYIVFLVAGTVLSFTFVSQFLWGGVIADIFTGGGVTFKMPGFIFSLTLDSILWMIITKILLGILSVVIFLITTVFFAVVALLGSVFTFIPSVLSKTAKDKKARARLNNI